MLISGVLDVAIGMVFVYLILSLITSAANEAIELKLKNRASDLEKGLRELLDPGKTAGGSEVVQQIYDHPLINGLFEGKFSESGIKAKAGAIKGMLKSTSLPSYIPSKNFALAVMDLALRGKVDVKTAQGQAEFSIDQLRAALNKDDSVIPPKARRALLTLVDTTEGDINKVRESFEGWFNSSMDRVSGWYKKRSQMIVIVIGFIVAFAVNADSVLIAKRLVSDKSLRAALASSATEYAKANATAPSTATNASEATKSNEAKKEDTKTALPAASPATTPNQPSATTSRESASRPPTACYPIPACEKDANSPQCKLDKSLCDIEALGLPIGWNYQDDPLRRWPGLNFNTQDGWLAQFYWHFLGWLITALAISLGAPFWFDLLNKFIVVRSTVKPREKSREEQSKD